MLIGNLAVALDHNSVTWGAQLPADSNNPMSRLVLKPEKNVFLVFCKFFLHFIYFYNYSK